MPKPSFILASASPRRKDLLASIGMAPEHIIPANIDETPRKNELPRAYVQRMAREKAQAVFKKCTSRTAQSDDSGSQHKTSDSSEKLPGSAYFILAADTVVACGRRILPKAESEAQARECLRILSGRRHQVLTAFALYEGAKKRATKCIVSNVQFKRLTQQDIDWYLTTGEWDGKAGGYAIQGAAQVLIQRLDGSYSAVVGLPLKEVRDALISCGKQPTKRSTA